VQNLSYLYTMKFLSYILLILTLFLFYQCKETDTSFIETNYDYRYYPLDSGAWREFQVKEINIDAPSEYYDTADYYLLEVFGGRYIDNSGDTVTKIERFVRNTRSENWQPANTWMAKIKVNMAIQYEENTCFIKLKFPAELGDQWNGNAYNRTDTLQLYSYKIESMDVPFLLNSLSFDSTLTVSQKNKVSAISKMVYFEKYALNVGMIQKQEININSQQIVDISIPIEQRVTQGYFYYANLIGYGK
jgi:hypothetical protein